MSTAESMRDLAADLATLSISFRDVADMVDSGAIDHSKMEVQMTYAALNSAMRQVRDGMELFREQQRESAPEQYRWMFDAGDET